MVEVTTTRQKLVRSILLILAFLAVGGAIGAVALVWRVQPPRREITALPPLVDTTVVRTQDVTEWFVGYGSAEPIHRAEIAAEVTARIIGRDPAIRAGAAVTAGQVILRLDDREYRRLHERAVAQAQAQQAALEELEADAQSVQKLIHTAEQETQVARNERARLADLFERNLAAKKEYDFANLAFQQARRVLQGYQREASTLGARRKRIESLKRGFEAEAAVAQLNIERCTISAPFDGRLQSIRVDIGDHVVAGSVVFTLLDPTFLEVPIQLPASVLSDVYIGAACEMASQSRRGVTWNGRVARVGPAIDEHTRTCSVYVEVDNNRQSQPLVPGTFVTARVRGPIHQDAILLPRSVCRNGHVLVAENGIARVRAVTTERSLGDHALVRGDLHIGDRVILSHLPQLTDGSSVRVRIDASTAVNDPSRGDEKSSAGSSASP